MHTRILLACLIGCLIGNNDDDDANVEITILGRRYMAMVQKYYNDAAEPMWPVNR